MISKCLVNISSKEGVDVAPRYLALAFALVGTCPAAPPCVPQTILPGGNALETHFLAAPLPRASEAVADAMQAAGIVLFKVSDQYVAGERADERVKVMGLQPGDEAVQATLEASNQGGETGTLVRVETRRRANKNGAPKHTWSAAVLEHAACLVTLLSLDDPAHRPAVPIVDGVEVEIPESTALEVRARHFLFNTDVKPNQRIPFETATPVVINGSVVIPSGLLAIASMDQASDIKDHFRGARGQLNFRYLVLPDGTRLLLRGTVALAGNDTTKRKGVLIAEVAWAGVGVLAETGLGFAIPAGTTMSVQLDGGQKFRVSHTANPGTVGTQGSSVLRQQQ